MRMSKGLLGCNFSTVVAKFALFFCFTRRETMIQTALERADLGEHLKYLECYHWTPRTISGGF